MIQLQERQAVISWPTNQFDYRVEATSSLAPTIVWTPLGNRIEKAATEYKMIDALSRQARFYRLRKL